MELKFLTEKAFLDSSEWDRLRILENLADYLQYYGLSLDKSLISVKQLGSPHTLIITSAGLRAANVIRYSVCSSQKLIASSRECRALRMFNTKDNSVAKLFAKHIRLRDAIDYVKQTR